MHCFLVVGGRPFQGGNPPGLGFFFVGLLAGVCTISKEIYFFFWWEGGCLSVLVAYSLVGVAHPG